MKAIVEESVTSPDEQRTSPEHPRREQAEPASQARQIRRSRTALGAIKAIHTLAWFSIESCMIYLLYTGATRRSDRRAAIAGAVVGAESLIFVANGFRCPLTSLAEELGAEHGSVTDIYLPRWFAHNLPAIHVPLLALATFLHMRNVWHRTTC